MTKEIFKLLIHHEGVRLKPYRCPAGKLTIGVGRNLDDVGISKEEAYELLKHDISRAATDLFATFPWVKTLDEPRMGALVDMTFNMGISRLKTFKKFTNFMKNKDFKAAVAEMLDSKWAFQVGDRAKRLAQMVDRGEWPVEIVK